MQMDMVVVPKPSYNMLFGNYDKVEPSRFKYTETLQEFLARGGRIKKIKFAFARNYKDLSRVRL